MEGACVRSQVLSLCLCPRQPLMSQARHPLINLVLTLAAELELPPVQEFPLCPMSLLGSTIKGSRVFPGSGV